ncbi:MAG: hypothetical protein NXI24_12225 [bacterium]|nr:hypothetical protein [bacterium]
MDSRHLKDSTPFIAAGRPAAELPAAFARYEELAPQPADAEFGGAAARDGAERL